MTAPVITIDGPSGSGKGTVARLIALELGFHLLDSGAIYRVLGLAATDARIQLDDSDALASLSDSLNLSFPYNAQCTQIILNGASVGDRLRTQVAADAASRVAIHPRVRDALMNLQRRQARDPGLVGDGRDLGTIVFPDADLKIFLDANVEVRAERRYLELIQSGQTVERSAILRDLEIRDVRDRTREVAPLIPANNAYVIDSSDKTAAQVVANIRDLWRARGLA
ncbi:MAG: (d)CMP kinase [Oceanospirillales bacterium TMED33]|nr:cytidylate kinase [Gammaproteobacteria bacterium]RPG19711.1 MAG: (d)CMP kinase [Oceanospirillales bacterium TMED33]